MIILDIIYEMIWCFALRFDNCFNFRKILNALNLLSAQAQSIKLLKLIHLILSAFPQLTRCSNTGALYLENQDPQQTKATLERI